MDKVTADLQKHEERQEYLQRQLDFFLADIEPMLNEIRINSERIKRLAEEYDDLDLTDIVKEKIREVV